jgi:DNA-binding response OmpR family regulator
VVNNHISDAAKILVVDDDVDNGLLLSDFLQISGFDMDVYISSEEASKNFESGRYSLAIIDVLMEVVVIKKILDILKKRNGNPR